MITESTFNNYSRMVCFENLLKYIETSNWRVALLKATKTYNVKVLNLKKLTPSKIRELYQRIHQRFYGRQNTQNRTWKQNQLRVFVWILIIMIELQGNSPQNINEETWKVLAEIFGGKSIQTCKFQYKSISQQQNDLLVRIIQQNNEINMNWNDISKKLFEISNQKYFKTSKQCREHWNNYLNPQVLKTPWSKQEDYLLMKQVIKIGRQWACISKHLQSKRTQHMVKNRFKSLVLAFSKDNNIPKNLSQSTFTLKNIYRKIKIEFQEIQQLLKENSNQVGQEKQKQFRVEQGLLNSTYDYPSFVSSQNSPIIIFPSVPVSSGPVDNFVFQVPEFYMLPNFMMPVHPWSILPGGAIPNYYILNMNENMQNSI